jgi:putative ABC transport system substrate-binding protein
MNRREVVAGLAGAAVWPVNAWAQVEDHDPKAIGLILQGGPWYAVVEGLKAGLQQNAKGEHLRLEIRDTRGDLQAVEDEARKFEHEKAPLIVAIATSVSVATQKATANIPIVFCAGTDPVLVGLVDSVTKPRSRITGVHMALTDTTGKRLEL